MLRPTEAIGNAGEHSLSLDLLAHRKAQDPTDDDVIGPYYRSGSPFRAKISPPLAPGDVLLIRGQVSGVRSQRPIAFCSIDIWQASANGHYDNDDPAHPPKPDFFINRARLQSDENGLYEFETIFPGPYKMDPTTWRSPHIHFLIRALGYKTLVTQLFFAGAPYIDTDPFMKRSLIIELSDNSTGGKQFRSGIFDIVLADDIDPIA